MASGRPIHKVDVAGHVIECGPVRVEGDHLSAVFRVLGPPASERLPKEHVVLIRPGDEEKLNSVDGSGGSDTPGEAFFIWRFDWPGGDEVRVVYLDGGLVIHDELVKL